MSWDAESSWGKDAAWDASNAWGAKDAAPAAEWGAADSWGAKEAAPAAATDSWDAKEADPWAKKDDAADAWGQKAEDPWAKKEDDAWGKKDTWGADDKADDKADWPAPSGQAFWDAQKEMAAYGTVVKKEDWELEADDEKLFKERLGTNAGIDFERYESVPVDVSGDGANSIPVCATFDEIFTEFHEFVPKELVANVQRCKYTKPTPVQRYAVPVGFVGRDIMCCAQTGSGKTAAFLMPAIGRLMKIGLDSGEQSVGSWDRAYEGKCSPKVLIMAPTRELVIQIYEEALKFCHRTQYKPYRVYGGEKSKEQLYEVAKGADILVAAPGRLKDFIDRGVITVEKTAVLVLDEADRMLDMGFEPQIKEIIAGMPEQQLRQTMMFSATFAENCQRIAQAYLYNYIWIGVGIVGGAVDTVEQTLEQVPVSDKYEKLVELLDAWYGNKTSDDRALVFVNAKNNARWLDEQLYSKSMDTATLHGDLDQTERETNLRRFRDGQVDVMVATDVAARGLDIEHVGLVINYDMPQEIDSYVHRIGRTGRIGNKGRAVTFIAVDENGSTLENLDQLKELVRVMNDSKAQIPPWLTGLIETGPSWGGGGKWGGKDMRGTWDDWKSTSKADDAGAGTGGW